MALSVSQTAAVQRILKPGMRVASMGYPDLIAPIEDMPGLEYRADSDAICKRHGLRSRRIPDANSFFALKGCELDVYDIVQERGREILCDLNEPLNLQWAGGNEVEQPMYDIVLDVGTLEHCFNIAQAAMNMAGLVKEGGYIIHENPFNWGNHGFYNLNPTWYADFYAANGFELLGCRLAVRDGSSAEAPRTERFTFTEREVNVFAMARRVEVKAFVFPTQTKYAKLITLSDIDEIKRRGPEAVLGPPDYVIPAAGVDRAKEKENG